MPDDNTFGLHRDNVHKLTKRNSDNMRNLKAALLNVSQCVVGKANQAKAFFFGVSRVSQTGQKNFCLLTG
jgi:hypothetical protein